VRKSGTRKVSRKLNGQCSTGSGKKCNTGNIACREIELFSEQYLWKSSKKIGNEKGIAFRRDAELPGSSRGVESSGASTEEWNCHEHQEM